MILLQINFDHVPRVVVYEAMGWSANRFLDDWGEVVEVQEQATLESSPVAQAVLLLMDKRSDDYEGTATNLYNELRKAALSNGIDVKRDKAWPSSARSLWRRMKEVLPLLASRGVAAQMSRCNHGTIMKLSKKADAA